MNVFSAFALGRAPWRALLPCLGLAWSQASAVSSRWHWNPDSVMTDGVAPIDHSHYWTAATDGSGLFAVSDRDDAFDGGQKLPAWVTRTATLTQAGVVSLAVDAIAFDSKLGSVDDFTVTSLYRADLTGDFDFSVRVLAPGTTGPEQQQGILVLNDFTAPSAGGAFAVYVSDGHLCARFDTEGSVGSFDALPSTAGPAIPAGQDAFLRAARSGNRFFAFYRLSVSTPWIMYANSTTQQAAASSQVGLFAVGSQTSSSGLLAFDDVQADGPLKASRYLDLYFDGTTAGGKTDAYLESDLVTNVFDLTGFGGIFSFGSAKLEVYSNSAFGVVNRGQGTLICNGTGTLRSGDKSFLPDLIKRGAGTLTLLGYPLNARAFTLETGSLDLGGLSAAFTSLATAAGTSILQSVATTLTVRGNADFTGAGPASVFGGAVYVSIMADATGPKTSTFSYAGAVFHDLRLEASPRSGYSGTLVVQGNASQQLHVLGNLVLSDGSSQATGEGIIDFQGPVDADLAADLQAVHPGGSAPALALRLGSAIFRLHGGLDLGPIKRIEPGTSQWKLDASSHGMRLQETSRDNGSLGAITVADGGSVNLLANLKATSFAMQGGTLALDGRSLAVSGDMELKAGAVALTFTGLGDAELRAGQNLRLEGKAGLPLDLDATRDWSAFGGASLTASYVNLGNSQATGVIGIADAFCPDAGSNRRWSFALAPPSIYRAPVDAMAIQGGAAAVFSVGAIGAFPLAFAWTRVGQSAVLSTDTTLAIANADTTMEGWQYQCHISNVNGDTNTSPVTLTVRVPAKVSAQPMDTAVLAGAPVAFAVAVEGTPPYTYAWTRVGNSTVIGTSPALNLVAAAADDGAHFRAVVSNAYGNQASREAVLTVHVPVRVTAGPRDTSLLPNRTAAFSVSLQGTPPFAYKWYRQGVAAALDSQAVLTQAISAADDGAAFFCIASNAYGTDTSRAARVSLLCDTLLQVAADSVAVDEGQGFSLAASLRCADDWKWEALAGPAPADAKALAQAFTAPRVAADSLLGYRFSARFNGAWRSREVKVLVKEAIPDPLFTLPSQQAWNGNLALALRPTVSNAAALAAASYHPPLNRRWSLSARMCDTLGSADSLILSNPVQDGTLEVTLCGDNGGEVHCAKAKVEIGRIALALRRGGLAIGPAVVAGDEVFWAQGGSARLWSWNGALLWSAEGRRGVITRMPKAASRSFHARQSRLEIRATPPGADR